MRKVVVVGMLALAGFGMLSVQRSRAQTPDYPWCVVYSGDQADGGEHCMFVSYEQCMMTASPGSGAVCTQNLRRGRTSRR